MGDEDSEQGDQDHISDDYAKRNRRKATGTDGPVAQPEPAAQEARRSLTSASYPASSPVNGYSLASERSYQQPGPYSPGGAIGSVEDGQDQEFANDTAAALFQSPINIPGDALHLLLKASGQTEDLQRKDLESQQKRSTGQSIISSPSSVPAEYRSTRAALPRAPGSHTSQPTIDPVIAGDRLGNGKSQIPKETLDIWSRLRFVKAGWFTAREGMSYLN